MNGFTVVGRLTREPNIRTTKQGDTVADIDIADSWKDRQGNDQVAYYRASFWNNTARTIQNYFHKGDPITIVGILHPTPYQDRNGNERISLDIDKPKFGFTPAPPRNRNNQNNQGYQQPQGQPNNGYQQNNQQPPQGQNQNGYQPNQQPQNGYQPNNQQQSPQQNYQPQQPQYQQQSMNTGNGWESTEAGQKRAQVNQQAQEISDNDLPFPTDNQETPF